jgi:hypothetical protein
MADSIMKAWSKYGRIYHIAAGRGPNTACGRRVLAARGWVVGEDAPEGRHLCEGCRRMAGDVGR